MATVFEPQPKTGIAEPDWERLPERASAKKGRRSHNLFAYSFLAPQLIGLG